MIRRVGARCAVTIALAVTTVVLLPATAGAASPPPGWVDQGPGLYVGFTLDPLNPAQHRSGADPVTLIRDTNLTAEQLEGALAWEAVDTNGDGTPELYWPTVFAAGGVELHRVTPCPYTATSCQYTVAAGWGSAFSVFGGSPPTDGGGNPAFDPEQQYNQCCLPAQHTPDIVFGSVNAVGTADPNGGPGKISVNAAGTVDEDNQALTYHWVLSTTNDEGAAVTQSGSSTAGDGAFEWTVDRDGTYCVQLTVTAADGYSKSSSACSGSSGGDYIFNISGVAPKEPDPGPDPTPTPTPKPTPKPSGGGGSPAIDVGGIVFSRGQRGTSARSTPTIVWLWRPEWYQSPPETTDQPETSGRPRVQNRRDIVVSSGPEGANAGPWLAGLSAVGIVGGGWLFSRRRRIRMLGDY